MELETLLTDALAHRAEVVQRTPGAWEENRLRVRRDRRLRAVAVGVAASLAVGGTAVALLQRGGPESTLRVAAPPAYEVDVEGYELVAPAAKVGTVAIDGRTRDVVAFLTVVKGRGDTDPVACVAVADPDGRVTNSSPMDACQGPAAVQGGSPFVLELLPLSQSSLPAQPCSFGPLGNLVLALVAPQTTGVTMRTAAGATIVYDQVPGTVAWPLRLFAGQVPLRDSSGGYRLVSGTTVLQDDPAPTHAGPRGCPTGRG